MQISIKESDVQKYANKCINVIEKLQKKDNCLFPGFAYLQEQIDRIKDEVEYIGYGLDAPLKAKEKIKKYKWLALHREMA